MSQTASRTVVDSSVVVKWFLQEDEEHVEEALLLLAAHMKGTRLLASPGHVVLEVLNALKSRGLGEPDLVRAAEALVAARLGLVAVEDLARAAAELATRHDLTLYDAAFAALAAALDAELITADRRLAESGACRVRLLGA